MASSVLRTAPCNNLNNTKDKKSSLYQALSLKLSIYRRTQKKFQMGKIFLEVANSRTSVLSSCFFSHFFPIIQCFKDGFWLVRLCKSFDFWVIASRCTIITGFLRSQYLPKDFVLGRAKFIRGR